MKKNKINKTDLDGSIFQKNDPLFYEFRIKPKNLKLYERAFTHKSFLGQYGTSAQCYENLEFLGDAVVSLGVAKLLTELYPNLNQGDYTKMRAGLVSSKSMASYSLRYNLNKYIRVGKTYQENIDTSVSLLEDVFEAFIGAIYLDQGNEKTEKVIKKVFYNEVKFYNPEKHIDFKSKLQEEIAIFSQEKITYETQPIGDKPPFVDFVSKVIFEGVVLGTGRGKNKKEAEQNAAKMAFKKRVD